MVGLAITKPFSGQRSRSCTQSRRGIDMKAVLAIPGGVVSRLLSREICGIPLFARTLATAQRAGVREFLILWSDSGLEAAIRCNLQSPPLKSGSNFHFLSVNGFDPEFQSSWSSVLPELPDRFLWIPWK